LAKKYPNKPRAVVLSDLVRFTPGDEGKWFAAAKDAKLFDEAVALHPARLPEVVRARGPAPSAGEVPPGIRLRNARSDHVADGGPPEVVRDAARPPGRRPRPPAACPRAGVLGILLD
jgi:hypothetical protein